MTRKRHSLTLLGCTLVAASLAGGSGCLSCLHPLGPPDKEHAKLSCILPQCSRNHVYIFFLNGNDPLDCSNLTGLCARLQDLGYIKTYFGGWYHTGYFATEICRLHREDPLARFVLVGFGCGADQARKLAARVEPEGAPIDLVVYLGGCAKEEAGEARPGNVAHVLNIQGNSLFGGCPHLDHATNINYPEVCQQGTVTHKQTVDTLVKELAQVTARVPVIEKVPPPDARAPEQLPHPVKPPKPGSPDDWDFLKPEQLPNAPTPGPGPKKEDQKK
jgi:hypothetical protein